VGDDLAVLYVNVVNVFIQCINEIIDINAKVSEVGRIEVETEFLAPARQFDGAQCGLTL
jgi:hypothetical protein